MLKRTLILSTLILLSISFAKLPIVTTTSLGPRRPPRFSQKS